jgi:hypothetical protein
VTGVPETTQLRSAGSNPTPLTVTDVPGGPEPGFRLIVGAAFAGGSKSAGL